jgi:hypothetical protein
MTSRSDSGKGSERNRAAFRMLNMATVAPMPTASVQTTATENTGLLAGLREA